MAVVLLLQPKQHCFGCNSNTTRRQGRIQGGAGDGRPPPVAAPLSLGEGEELAAPRRGANTDGAPNLGVSEKESGIDTLHQAPKKGVNTKRSTRNGC